MNPPKNRTGRSTVASLKGDIDRGRTRDKVPVFDPAAAPLGTDDEAAGTPPDPDEIALARANETKAPAYHPPERAPPRPTAWIWAAAVLLAVVGLVLALA